MDAFSLVIAVGSVIAVFVLIYVVFVRPHRTGTVDKDPDA